MTLPRPRLPRSAGRAGESGCRPLDGVAVHRCRIPVMNPSDGTRKCSRERLGRVVGTAHRELDLLIDLAGQAPNPVLWPHQVRLLIHPPGAVPSQGRCVSEHFDRSSEQQHGSVGDEHARSGRSREPALPAFPDRRIRSKRRGGVAGERPECQPKAKFFAWLIGTVGILVEGDAQVHVEAGWAVSNEVPPVDVGPEQPFARFGTCRWPYARHLHSLTQHDGSAISTT